MSELSFTIKSRSGDDIAITLAKKTATFIVSGECIHVALDALEHPIFGNGVFGLTPKFWSQIKHPDILDILQYYDHQQYYRASPACIFQYIWLYIYCEQQAISESIIQTNMIYLTTRYGYELWNEPSDNSHTYFNNGLFGIGSLSQDLEMYVACHQRSKIWHSFLQSRSYAEFEYNNNISSWFNTSMSDIEQCLSLMGVHDMNVDDIHMFFSSAQSCNDFTILH